jgi:pyruvate formate lyase activating enzyme
MIIGGLQKFSTIDFPEKLAAVIFTRGCNFRCPFCHNFELISEKNSSGDLDQKGVLDFLRRRIGKLDGVVLSGGEPTLHSDLADFILDIKNLGFEVKLDTNGSWPEIIRSLLGKGLLAYIAMDIKHVYAKYTRACGLQIPSIERIKESVSIITNSDIAYEFRTTMVPGIHVVSDALDIAMQLDGAKRFAVQEFMPNKTLALGNSCKNRFYRKDFELLRQRIETYVDEFVIRY